MTTAGPNAELGARAETLPRLLPLDAAELGFAMPLGGQAIGRLDITSKETFDLAPFGVVALSRDGAVLVYNRAEATLSGLDPARVVGRRFFTSVAPCTNNFLVAHRFTTETALDDVIDYLFTFKMAPTLVRLRLIKHPDAEGMYLFVEKNI